MRVDVVTDRVDGVFAVGGHGASNRLEVLSDIP
jgi:hypothetical protein